MMMITFFKTRTYNSFKYVRWKLATGNVSVIEIQTLQFR